MGRKAESLVMHVRACKNPSTFDQCVPILQDAASFQNESGNEQSPIQCPIIIAIKPSESSNN